MGVQDLIIIVPNKKQEMSSNNSNLYKSGVSSPVSFKKSPNKYLLTDVRTDETNYMERSMHNPPRKQWGNNDSDIVRKTSGDYTNGFEMRTNYKLQQALSKSSAYAPDDSSSNAYPRYDNLSKTQYYSKPMSPNQFNNSAVSDRLYRKDDFYSTYSSKNDKTVKSPVVDKKIDIQEKYKQYTQYAEAVEKFKEHVETTSKMSEQLKKLKEDRKKRLQAKEKQKQKEISELRQKQRDAMKKKKQPSTYIVNQQKTYTDKNGSNNTKLALNLDKYKTYTSSASTKQTYTKQPYSPYSKQLYSKQSSKSTAISSTALTTKKKSQQLYNGQIKDFILGRLLGEGKFGTVYQAFHKPTNSLYAIKKIPKELIKSHLMVDQFCLQLKLQMYLNHENILTLFSFFDDKTSIYLVLEYMDEGTLFAHLKKNRKLPQQQVAVKIKQIASAIKYLHDHQIAHRDIKPQNIVMSHGVCKLCDFGWATICDQRRKTYCGTFDYAPPEILEGAQYDYTVDLWCLGVLAYELLVGKAPFYHISRKQTMKKILNVQKTVIEYPDFLSKNAISFIENLIKKNPKQRISSEQLLDHPFLRNVVTKMDLNKKF